MQQATPYVPVAEHLKRHQAFTRFFILLFATLWLCGCIEHRYYVSPFNGNQSVYHPIPLKSDMVKSGYYAAAGFAAGSANDQGVDDITAFHGSLSGGHNIGPFQAFYSVNIAAGIYTVDSAENVAQPGRKPYSGTGFEGGFNVVVPMRRGEWRVAGIETAWWSEQGKYLQFRKQLPADAADLVLKNKRFVTLGGYSEFLTHGPKTTLGFRLGGGTVMDRAYHFLDTYPDPQVEWRKYSYFYINSQLTRKRYTGFVRLNFASKADNALFGLVYRIL